MSRLLLIALLTSLGLCGIGCAGDPDFTGVSEAISLRTPVERLEWEAALAGCEDERSLGARIHRVVGEPLLGALVDPTGRVLCVDAISTLREGNEPRPQGEQNWDPTPTPLTPTPELLFSP